MKYIGLISDTHGFFDARLKEFLSPVDEIWHCGDFASVKNADEIARFKPLKGVFGNCDGGELRRMFQRALAFTEGGMKVLMMHIGGYPGRYDAHALDLIAAHRPDLFICGHSHILKVMHDKRHDMLVMNPGAAGRQGFHVVRTALRFHIGEGRATGLEVGEWPKNEIDNSYTPIST